MFVDTERHSKTPESSGAAKCSSEDSPQQHSRLLWSLRTLSGPVDYEHVIPPGLAAVALGTAASSPKPSRSSTTYSGLRLTSA